MKLLKHLPNLLTCANVAAGSIGIIAIFEGELQFASYMVWLAAFFDFFDGFAARMVKVTSELGKQLDSMADMISFGALPGFFMYSLLGNVSTNPWIPYIGLSIVVFSALRLAKFNIDTRQSEVFIGVPTPANALFVTSLIYLLQLPAFSSWLNSSVTLSLISIVCSLLLVAEIRLLSLKFKSFDFQPNLPRYLMIVMSVILLLVWNKAAISLIIVGYILFSVVLNLKKEPLRKKST